MKKKYAALFVSGALLISNAGLLKAESFEGRESEMNAKCAVIKDTKTQEECSRYKEYLQSKSDNLDKEISDIKSQIASVKGDVEKVSQLIADNNKKIAGYEKEISSIQASIDQTQSSISDLKAQIKEKEESIKERDKQMRARLLEMQAYTGSNYYIDFLMGSTSFTDLLRRTEIVGELNKYENDQIKTLNKEKKKLDQDRKIVEEQKELLVVQQKDVKSSKAKVEALNEVKKDLLSDYHAKEANLATQKREAQMAQANLPKVDLSLAADFDEPEQKPEKPDTPQNGGNEAGNSGNTDSGDGNTDNGNTDSGNSGSDNNGNSGGNSGNNSNNGSSGGTAQSSSFIAPLQSGWHYEAGTWSYPGGGGHMGMDFSTGSTTGIPVVAPANGIIIHTYQGCGYGALNNWCGIPAGGGNNVALLTRVDGVVYAMPFYHLSSVAVSVGQRVNQGQVMGYSGSSGNSSGPHCHVEIIRVGSMTMTAALNQFNRTGDLTFGTGWNADAPNACGSAPCRERPENFWLR